MVVPVIPTDVTGEPLLHQRAEGGGPLRLQDNVKVIGHHTEAEQPDGEFLPGRVKQVTEGTIVRLFVEKGGATVAAIEDMIGEAGHLPAGMRGMAGMVPSSGDDGAKKVAWPLSPPSGGNVAEQVALGIVVAAHGRASGGKTTPVYYSGLLNHRTFSVTC